MDTNENNTKTTDVKFSVLVTFAAAFLFFALDMYTGVYSGYYTFNERVKTAMDVIRIFSGYAVPSVIALAVSFLRDSTKADNVNILKSKYLMLFGVATVVYAFLVTCCYMYYDLARAILILLFTAAYLISCMKWFIDRDSLFRRYDTGNPN